MSNFISLDLPHLNLLEPLEKLVAEGKVSWWNNIQICLNSTVDNPNDFLEGAGSLYYDYDKLIETTDENGYTKEVIPLREKQLQEQDFVQLCDVFKGTEIEQFYNHLTTKFKVGRVRFMKSKVKTCLSWHADTSPRLHYPVKTQEGCFMVIDGEIKHLKQNHWYLTDTTKKHTAFNSSTEERIHIVAAVLEDGHF